MLTVLMRIEKAQMMLERYESGDNQRELNEQEEFDEDLISLSTSNSPRNNINISTESSSLNPEINIPIELGVFPR